MASTASAGTAAKAASSVAGAAPQAAKQAIEQAAVNLKWIRGMPTRAIADALMKRENRMAPHEELYNEINKTGILRSRRHFKHCLRMLRTQRRVDVICQGPDRVGSNRLKFAVKLTRRGDSVYSYFKRMETQEAERGEGAQPGLKDALP